MFNWLIDFFTGRTFGATRSNGWSRVRRIHLKEHPLCACCRKKSALLTNEVHHIQPFHLEPSLELDPANLITLCRPCHHLIGHLKSWSSYNEDVEVDARILRDKIINRP